MGETKKRAICTDTLLTFGETIMLICVLISVVTGICMLVFDPFIVLKIGGALVAAFLTLWTVLFIKSLGSVLPEEELSPRQQEIRAKMDVVKARTVNKVTLGHKSLLGSAHRALLTEGEEPSSKEKKDENVSI